MRYDTLWLQLKILMPKITLYSMLYVWDKLKYLLNKK